MLRFYVVTLHNLYPWGGILLSPHLLYVQFQELYPNPLQKRCLGALSFSFTKFKPSPIEENDHIMFHLERKVCKEDLLLGLLA